MTGRERPSGLARDTCGALRAAASLALALAVGACSPAAPDPCGASVVCEPGERCFEASCDVAARCTRGLEAELYGRAGARDGGCVATDDADCRHSTVTCPLWGQCSAPPAAWAPVGACPDGARHDGDFTASRRAGCAGRGGCVALHNDDCENARVCSLEGRCAAQDGVCVAVRDADCKRSGLCRELGHCTLDAGACKALSSADCLGSAACRERGDCGVVGGGCGDCRRSEGCAREGWCELGGDSCRATRPEHCRDARACKVEGRCRPVLGRCVKG